ncbi:MAG: hypothetical protein QF408_01040 [Pirellulales bacterium]|jgi:hypothetical protein|nr:hypothetical protein [Pirellulales bacterium]
MLFAYFDISLWVELVCLAGILLCSVVVIVVALRPEGNPLLGILCALPTAVGAFVIGWESVYLTPIAAYLIGWANCRKWKITQLMTVFTGLVLVLFVVQLYRLYVGSPGLGPNI